MAFISVKKFPDGGHMIKTYCKAHVLITDATQCIFFVSLTDPITLLVFENLK